MKRILQGLHAVEGVQGTLVVAGNGQILAYQAHALYDISLLEQVSQTIVSAIDAVQLLQEEWEMVSASFADGNLLLKGIRPSGSAAGRNVVLGVIADTRLNFSFVGVAIRIAASKLKAFLESPGGLSSSGISPPSAPANGEVQATPSPVLVGNSGLSNALPTEVGSSGLSWSGLGSSSGKSSEVTVADPQSSALLSACTKVLATSVGPMAKVFVKEAVRKLCPDRPFSRAHAEQLIALLLNYIEDPAEAAQFQKKIRVLVQ